MELAHLLTRSGLTCREVSSKDCHDSFCQLGNSVLLPWVIYCEAFSLHVVSSSSCIPVICPELVLFLIPLKFVYLFCNLPKYILLFFSYISSLLLLLFCVSSLRDAAAFRKQDTQPSALHQPDNLKTKASNTTGSNHLYNTAELLMMGIMVPETCCASNWICNK